MMKRFLYRGISVEMHATLHGELRPKETKPFVKPAEWERAEWGNSFWGESTENAVVEHQQHQAGFPTSGISTTPILERAKFYATNGGKVPHGYIYVIDADALVHFGVTTYVVNEIVPMPSVPEDEEIILVAKDFGSLPQEIVVEIIECKD